MLNEVLKSCKKMVSADIKTDANKNGVKGKQLAKQPPTLMQNIFVRPWIKSLIFSISSSLKLNFSTTFFATT